MCDIAINEKWLFRAVDIVKKVRYSDEFFTLLFEDDLCSKAKPGQFVMVTLPGIDMMPFSLSHINENGLSGVTVKVVGEGTKALSKVQSGEKIGLTGPFGKGFRLSGDKIIIIGGGIGFAPLRPLMFLSIGSKMHPIVVVGARTAEENIFHTELQELAKRNFIEYVPVTDDGSLGRKCFPTEVLNEIYERFDLVYAVGPEVMLKRIYDICRERGLKLQVSLERYMRCGIGLCGQCVLDPTGLLVCRHGPVFTIRELKNAEAFGSYRRDHMGRIVPV
jgi:dihydroorotate dehydrogenase electron transfer subunit